MCIICVHYEKEKLTWEEGLRNLQEMRAVIGEEHAEEVEKMLLEDSPIVERFSNKYAGGEEDYYVFDYMNSDYFGSD